MDIKIIESIEHIWTKAKETGFFDNISKIYDLLFHPRKFWADYNTLSFSEKWFQFICYATVFALFVWWSHVDLSVPEIGKIVIGELVSLVVLFIIIYFANVLVDHSLKEKIINVIVYCCYVKLIAAIPVIISIKLSHVTESYFYLALGFIFGFIIDLYLYFISAFVFQKGRKKVILAFLLTLVMVNIFDGLYIASGFRGSNHGDYDDFLFLERKEYKRSLKIDVYSIPFYVCNYESKDSVWYLYTSPFDSIARRIYIDDNKYMNDLQADKDSIDGIIKICKFDSNKDYFKTLSNLYKVILHTHEQKTYEYNPIVNSRYINNDTIIYRLFNTEANTLFRELALYEIDLKKQYETAIKTGYLSYAFHPFLFIQMWFKKMNDTQMT